MSIILHIDFNSYFASVEQQANPFLRGKPLAIAGKGKIKDFHRTVVTTASREAKCLGVKTAMASYQAMKICPELLVIPGDPRKYSEITARFLKILRKHCDVVEQFSTDEAFTDVTSASGGDYFGAALLAQMIKHDIAQECGNYCTASVGIAPNKLLAKLASESMKPNGLTVIRPQDVDQFILSQELQAVCGIGPRIAERLERLGISSMISLRQATLPLLRREFKSYGDWLYQAARGLGDDQVSGVDEAPKSVGHSYTFPNNLDRPEEVRRNLLSLCDKVAYRLRRDGLIATHVSAYVRYGDFSHQGQGKKIQEPIEDGLDLFKNAWRLLEPKLNYERGIRLIGISASGLLKTSLPLGIFKRSEKIHRTLRALDELEHRYGSNVWLRASTMGTVFHERVSGWHYDHEC